METECMKSSPRSRVSRSNTRNAIHQRNMLASVSTAGAGPDLANVRALPAAALGNPRPRSLTVLGHLRHHRRRRCSEDPKLLMSSSGFALLHDLRATRPTTHLSTDGQQACSQQKHSGRFRRHCYRRCVVVGVGVDHLSYRRKACCTRRGDIKNVDAVTREPWCCEVGTKRGTREFCLQEKRATRRTVLNDAVLCAEEVGSGSHENDVACERFRDGRQGTQSRIELRHSKGVVRGSTEIVEGEAERVRDCVGAQGCRGKTQEKAASERSEKSHVDP